MKQVKVGNYISLISNEDERLVSKYTWRPFVRPHTVYAVTGDRALRMHVLIMGRTGIDHINGNGLDNQRSNLRFATGFENQANRRKFKKGSSRYKGVHFYRGRWMARISIVGQRIYLGTFDSEIEAAIAYDDAARDSLGEFAALNFPDEAKGENSCI